MTKLLLFVLGVMTGMLGLIVGLTLWGRRMQKQQDWEALETWVNKLAPGA